MTSTTDPDPTPAPHALWPLTDVRVISGDLELRYLDDALLFELAELAAAGVHSPDAMPFTFPWTRGTPQEVARSVLAYQWGVRSRLSPQDWTLELAVVRDGRVLGVQSVMAKDFTVAGALETGSWLGLRHQGAGVGTRMRLMILHLAFEGLGAQVATTSAFEDNPGSNGVTRKIGYLPNGRDAVAREGSPAVSQRYVLDRTAWDRRAESLRPEVTLHGVESVRTFLGLAPQVTTTTAAS
ncbi:Protein N-acetyltransferase, RimJ/RimL family [Sanguibacter gelidistatuariae]|uniref:Protein N-acetyltransferase, RimJ/RimL family n=1 Tax=Sanguibacter gelidistatuariae TaxID=1814289 RepID=A0A1G6HEK6_9MICO|nr:GNAT family protein [Sanguibacter gelidistatuariae]SDB92692.1 Protein N-acetyltransferase, RimJ/RimL family [Sanguibacter gelidistatuariae]